MRFVLLRFVLLRVILLRFVPSKLISLRLVLSGFQLFKLERSIKVLNVEVPNINVRISEVLTIDVRIKNRTIKVCISQVLTNEIHIIEVRRI